MEKKYLFLLLLLLTVGFASVNTYLDINGKVDMSILESDLDVVFKEVLLNKEKSDNTIIIENGKSFIYSANDLTSENNTSTLDYVVMNRSHQYDVEVTVSCTTDYETYLNYNGTFDNQTLPLEKGILIEAGEVKSGNIIAELKSENTSEESLVLKCTLNYIPVSRETIVEDEEYLVTLDSGYEEQLGDIKVKYYEEYNKLPELTRSNYKFLGWYTEEDIKVDNNSLVKIKGNHTLKAKWEKICPYEEGKEWIFGYTGSEQEFRVPCDGNYKMELWGASGGKNSTSGGRGAYVSGNLQIEINVPLYIFVGGQGNQSDSNVQWRSGGYNGGGRGINYGGSGGGATDIRILNKNIFDRIIVAAGGGGYGYSGGSGGHAGGLSGYGAVRGYGSGGTQTSGNAMGSGGDARLHSFSTTDSGGGGGGYYGGFGGGTSSTTDNGNDGGGGGGSSFISGHSGCNAINSSGAHTGQPNHYSGYVFTNTKMIAGNGSMPNYAGTSTMTGNSGNGYAKITYLGD